MTGSSQAVIARPPGPARRRGPFRHARRCAPPLVAALALAGIVAWPGEADALTKQSITVHVSQIEAVMQYGSKQCTGSDAYDDTVTIALEGTRTLTYQHACGNAIAIEQVTVETRCPGGLRSCAASVSVVAGLVDLADWRWVVWGPVETRDAYIRMEMEGASFSGYVHSR
jgi:hypothetical protein